MAPRRHRVRIPDRGLAPLLAARVAAAVLVDPALDAVQRIDAIQALVPVAAANPTALDTVLARLLLAARPADPARLGAVDEHHRHLVAVPPRLTRLMATRYPLGQGGRRRRLR